MNVFTYGSLMYHDIWAKVVRGRYRSSPAVLKGYQRLAIHHEVYPALWPAESADQVDGVLYRAVSNADLLKLDRFEGEYYRRIAIHCEVGGEPVKAQVYLFRPEYQQLLTNQIWDAEMFERHGLRRFLDAYSGFMTADQ